MGGTLSARWIDLLRSAMVLTQAGARTVPMPTNQLALARLTGDPTTSWHGENAALVASEATFGAVTLSAKTITCLVKLSLELSQDAANIEEILESSITSALALEIDRAGLTGVTTNTAAGPSGIYDLTGRSTVTGVGAPVSWDFVVDGAYELLSRNVPISRIGALIAHPALWKKMTKLKTGLSGDATPLVMPEAVARVPKLWTTSAPLSGGTAKAVMGAWGDLLFGVRKDITVRLLGETFLGSNLQVALLAYARVDFAATRPESFVTMEGITV